MLIKCAERASEHFAFIYLFAIFVCIFNDVYFKIMLLVNNEGIFVYAFSAFVALTTRLNLIVAFEAFAVTFWHYY